MLLKELRKEVCWGNFLLPEKGLVAWTSGNVSARDKKTGYVVVKPSGVSYEDLTPAKLLVVDLNSKVIEGKLKPSVDTLTHLYIYRHRPDVNSVVHTHSPYATSFAVIGKPIPVCMTGQADEFGMPVPIAPFARIGTEAIGKLVVKYIGKSIAILLKNHGVFTIGKNVRGAVKAAVMLEEIAKTYHLALMKGKPIKIPDSEVEKLYRRYQEKYGQEYA